MSVKEESIFYQLHLVVNYGAPLSGHYALKTFIPNCEMKGVKPLLAH